jgi:HJR/Mrr/RecB family endonuclease
LAERAHDNAAGEPAIVVQRAYELALWLLQKVEKFPRSFRFSVGDRVIARILDLMESLVEAAYAPDKGRALDKAARDVNSLRLLLRLTVDLKLLSQDSHEFASRKLEEIGRMTGGWRKAAARRPHS